LTHTHPVYHHAKDNLLPKLKKGFPEKVTPYGVAVWLSGNTLAVVNKLLYAKPD